MEGNLPANNWRYMYSENQISFRFCNYLFVMCDCACSIILIFFLCRRFRRYRRPHKRGLEQICLPLVLISAIIPAVTPAQIIDDTIVCAFRPAAKTKSNFDKKIFSTEHQMEKKIEHWQMAINWTSTRPLKLTPPQQNPRIGYQ